ncbi:MAG: hypothetical protein KDA80_16570 [Planctomycetaceae bacterium]|nr:hypothetical protein [Planctomycetaceae bacterium]
MLSLKMRASAILVAASLMNTTWAGEYPAPPAAYHPQALAAPVSYQQGMTMQRVQAQQQAQIQQLQLTRPAGQTPAPFRLAGTVRQMPASSGYPQQQVQQVNHYGTSPAPYGAPAGHAYPQGYVNQGQYPHLNAPLYPSPVQYTPPWSGGTIITNQALAPHETLYPHTYHAMYPPFYHKVKGSWILTPFGIRQHEHWKLQGTEVTVKYRSSYPLFSNFMPPRVD